MPDTVWITGASSQLGVFLLPRTLDAGLSATAVSRRAPDEGLTVGEGLRWLRPEQLLGLAGQGPEDEIGLVSCGPLELAVALVRSEPRLRRVVAFSTSSIESKKDSGDARERRQIGSLAAAEERLGSLCAERQIPLLLVRPTLIYGCGLDRNISLLRQMGEKSGVIPVSSRAGGMRQPVHADDLAALAVAAMKAPDAPDLVSPAAGGSTLSYREMVQKVAEACLRKVRVQTVRAGVMAFTAGCVSLLRPETGINAEMVRRQAWDLVFDDTALRRILAYEPRPFAPTIRDFSIPPEAARLQLPAGQG